MPLPVSIEAAEITASTRDLDTSSGAISIVAEKSVKRPRTLEMPRCWATAPTEEWAGSTVQGPGGGSSVPPWRARVTWPISARPLAVTIALEAAGAYPTAVTITVYAPGARAVVSCTAPSASASARSTCVPVMSVTVTTACDTAHPFRVRIRAVSPIPFSPCKASKIGRNETGPWGAHLRSECARPHGPGYGLLARVGEGDVVVVDTAAGHHQCRGHRG